MTNLSDVRKYGKVDFLESGNPSTSVAGARVNHVYCDKDTGTRWTCEDDTFGFQVWRSDAGAVINGNILATNNVDLVALYTMESFSGSTLLDSSPNGNDSLSTVGTLTQTNGVIANSIDFPGTSGNRYEVPYFSEAETGNFCIAFWLSLDAASFIFYQVEGGGNRNLDIQGGAGAIAMRVYDSSDTFNEVGTTTTGFLGGEWNFFVFQCDGTDLKCYLNGVEEGSTTLTKTIRSLTANMIIGEYPPSLGAAPLDGRLDQVRFFNRALTPAEITLLYQEGISEITAFDNPSLVAAYTMDSVTGSTLEDETANNRDGTLVGTVTQTAGQIGQALDFAGGLSGGTVALDYVSLEGATGIFKTTVFDGSHSISGWVQVDSVPDAGNNATIFCTRESGTSGSVGDDAVSWLSVTSTGLLRLRRGSNNSRVQCDTPEGAISIGTSTVYHIVCNVTYNSSSNSTVEIYIDGALAASISGSHAALTPASNVETDLGALNWVNGGFDKIAPLDGWIDQFRLFNRTLSSAEIAELYNGGLGA